MPDSFHALGHVSQYQARLAQVVTLFLIRPAISDYIFRTTQDPHEIHVRQALHESDPGFFLQNIQQTKSNKRYLCEVVKNENALIPFGLLNCLGDKAPHQPVIEKVFLAMHYKYEIRPSD